MSKRTLFKNAFQQIKRTWAKTDEIDFRLASFDRRILDLEDVAHTPSEAENKPQAAGMPDLDEYYYQRLDRYMAEHKVQFISCELAAGLAKPAPVASEPTSEPDDDISVTHLGSYKTIEDAVAAAAAVAFEEPAPSASDRFCQQLYVEVPRDDIDSNKFVPATLAQLRQAAVGAGMPGYYSNEDCSNCDATKPEWAKGDIRNWTIQETIARHFCHYISTDEAVSELERRILQARERGYEDRFGVARPEAAKPEPEPTKHYSFREAAKIIQDNHWIDMGEPRSDTLYVLVQTSTTNSETDSIDVHWHHEQATKEQVFAEAARLGLLKE